MTSGSDPVFKVCPACGSVLKDRRLRCDCGYLFVFRRFLDKQNPQQITEQDLYVARKMGEADGMVAEMARSKADLDQAKRDQEAAFRAGMLAEKAKNDAEWIRFFEKAQLKNTISGGPICSRDDFYKWAAEYDAAKAEIEKKRRAERG